jgi:hypothetical protein
MSQVAVFYRMEKRTNPTLSFREYMDKSLQNNANFFGEVQLLSDRSSNVIKTYKKQTFIRKLLNRINHANRRTNNV